MIPRQLTNDTSIYTFRLPISSTDGFNINYIHLERTLGVGFSFKLLSSPMRFGNVVLMTEAPRSPPSPEEAPGCGTISSSQVPGLWPALPTNAPARGGGLPVGASALSSSPVLSPRNRNPDSAVRVSVGDNLSFARLLGLGFSPR